MKSKKKFILEQGEAYTVYYRRMGLDAPTLKATKSIEFNEDDLTVCKTLSSTKIRYLYRYKEPPPLYKGEEVNGICFWKDRT